MEILEAKLQDLFDRFTYANTMYSVLAGLTLNCVKGHRHAETIFVSSILDRCLLIIPEGKVLSKTKVITKRSSIIPAHTL
jgi:hypothetical protein